MGHTLACSDEQIGACNQPVKEGLGIRSGKVKYKKTFNENLF